MIDQAYVAPLPVNGTEAVFPAEPAHTTPGAVIVEEGAVMIVTFVQLMLLQPVAFVAVTQIVTVPLVPAVQVMFVVPCPAVIVPLLMDQLRLCGPILNTVPTPFEPPNAVAP